MDALHNTSASFSASGRATTFLLQLWLPNLDGVHLDGHDWPVTSRGNFGDGHSNVVATDDLAEDGVLRCARAEPIQVAVVCDIEEELRAA